MTRHREASAAVNAKAAALFELLDDQERLAAHMQKPSMMMGGGAMGYEFDAAKGRAVGSHIIMRGHAFGLEIFVDEVVTEREPPRSKVWRTVGYPKLVIIGDYVMGFEITPVESRSKLRVWIEYELPERGPGRWAPFLAGLYARWCVEQMVADAIRTYGSVAAEPPAALPGRLTI